ncbi:MAG: hypothetical protein ACQCN5_12265 [Candidatus Bathyarchaeia archaeon]
MLFKHKSKLEVDFGDLEKEKENLSNFLQQHLKVEVSEGRGKLAVDAEKVSITDLYQTVKKFVYHRHLNNVYWVSEEVSKVKINKFKGHEKKEKEKHKKEPLHQSEVQTWGL